MSNSLKGISFVKPVQTGANQTPQLILLTDSQTGDHQLNWKYCNMRQLHMRDRTTLVAAG